jgi:AcrR family transcriptional regulator
VARATGVSQTAPYNHFADKEHLLVALAASGFNKLTALQVAAADHSREARKKIVAIGCAYVSFARTHPQLYRLMFGVGIADWDAHPEVEQIKHASYVPVQKALAAYLGAATATETEALGTVNVTAWALVHGLSMLIIDGALTSASETSGNLDALVEEVIKRFVKGLSR